MFAMTPRYHHFGVYGVRKGLSVITDEFRLLLAQRGTMFFTSNFPA